MTHMNEISDKPIALIDMDGNWLQWGIRLNEILLRLDPSCRLSMMTDAAAGTT